MMLVPEYRDGSRAPWSALPISTLIDRLEEIAAYHRNSRGNNCFACHDPWPCATRMIATGNYGKDE